MGPRAAHRRAAGRRRASPRTTLKGGVGLFTQPPQPQETNPVFGHVGPHQQPRATTTTSASSASSRATSRPRSRASTSSSTSSSSAGLGNTGDGRRLRRRDAHPLQARRALLRLDRVHALAERCGARSPARPLRTFAFDQTHILTRARQLPPRARLGVRRALPTLERVHVHAERSTASTTRTSARTSRSRSTRRTTRACRSSTRSTSASTRRGSSRAA